MRPLADAALPPSCTSPHPCSATRQGSTLTFSLRDPSGQYLSWRAAAQAMMEAGLHVSSWQLHSASHWRPLSAS